MTIICVQCKRPIVGTPYDSEQWVGEWCSEECKKAFDDHRDAVYLERKGETTRIGIWHRIGDDGLPPLACPVERLHPDNTWELIGRIVDMTEYGDTPPGDTSEDGPPTYDAELFKSGRYVEAGSFASFDAALARLVDVSK